MENPVLFWILVPFVAVVGVVWVCIMSYAVYDLIKYHRKTTRMGRDR